MRNNVRMDEKSLPSPDTPSVARILAQYVCGIHIEQLPKKAIERAKSRILVVLDCALAGYDLPWSQAALNLATSRSTNSEATLFTHYKRVSVEDAAFANAVMSHSIFQEDTDIQWGGHPSVVVVPTALAVGETWKRSGAEVVAAIVAGYEVMTRLGHAIGPSFMDQGFRSTPLFGLFGTTATAARLMGLDEDATTTALNYAAHITSGLNRGWDTGTMEGMFQVGITTHKGIFIARVAKAGFSAAEDSIEGRRGFLEVFGGVRNSSVKEISQKIVSDLGASYGIFSVSDKPFPACNINQSTIDIGLAFSREKYSLDQIMKVVVVMEPYCKSYQGIDTYPPYHNSLEAQMSCRFCQAASLLGRPVQNPRFWAEAYDDPEVVALANKVELIGEEGRTKHHRRVEVHLTNGQVLVIDEDKAPSTLIWDDEPSKERFLRSTQGIFGLETSRMLLERIIKIECCHDLQEILCPWRERFKGKTV